MKKRSQIAMEYVIMIGVVFLLLIPAMYLFRDYVSASREQMVGQNINYIANDILNTAREMYYLGTPSKRVIEVDMPDGIDNIAVYARQTELGIMGEYSLIFVLVGISGRSNLYYQSDVPIIAYDEVPGVCIESPNTGTYFYGSSDECDDFDETNCNSDKCTCLPKRDFSKGKKYFSLEASKRGCPVINGEAMICIHLDEVSNELSC